MPTPEEEKSNALKKLIADQKEEIELRKRLNKIAKNNKKDLDAEIEAYNELITSLREQNVAIEEVLAIRAKGADASNLAIERLKKEIANTNEKNKLDDKTIKQKEELIKLYGEEEDKLKDIQKANEELAKSQVSLKLAAEAAKNLGIEVGSTAAGILGIDMNWRESGLTGRFIDAADKASGIAQTMKEVATNVGSVLNPMNMLASLMTKLSRNTVDFAAQMDGALGEIKKVTTAGSEVAYQLSEISITAIGAGLSVEEAKDSYIELSTEMKFFTRLSKDQQTELAKTLTVMKGFGVSAQSGGAAMKHLTESMRFSAKETVMVSNDLIKLAHALDEPPSVIFDNYGAATEMMAQFGKRGVEEFKKLSASAKASGIAMNNLLEIAGQFDTFETAGDHVGRLNAILGGAYFDTVTMVAATEADRIELLRRGVQATGKSFGALGRFERKAIAAAAGISDLNDANRLFTMTTEDYAEMTAAIDGTGKSFGELSKEARDNLSVQEKFSILLDRITPMLDTTILMVETLADGFHSLLDIVESVADYFGVELGTAMLIFLPLLRGGIKLIFKFTGFMFGAAKSLLGFGTAALKAGPIVATTGKVAGAASAGFMKLSLAILAIGAGIGAATAGIGLMVMGLTSMFEVLGRLPTEKIEALGGFMKDLALAGLGGIFGAMGLGGLAFGLVGVAGALALFPEKELEDAAKFFEALGYIDLDTTKAVAALSTSLASLSSISILGGTDAIEKMTALLKALHQVDKDKAIEVEKLINASINLIATRENKNINETLDKILGLMKTGLKNTNIATGTGAAAAANTVLTPTVLVLTKGGLPLAEALKAPLSQVLK